MSDICYLLKVSEEDKENVQKTFDKSEKEAQEDLIKLKEWIQEKKDIPKDIDDKRLFNLLARNKFRLEKTKTKIQHYYQVRRSLRILFNPKNLHPNSEKVRNVFKKEIVTLLPNLTPSGERIIFYKILQPDISPCRDISAFGLFLLDIAISHDYSSADRIIVDIEGFRLRNWLTYDLITLYKVLSFYKNGVSARIGGMHLVHAPSFINLILVVLKSAIKEGKIYVHSKMDEVTEFLPIEYLPNDYGGKQGFLEEISGKWLKEIENYHMDWARRNYDTDSNLLKLLEEEAKHTWLGSLFA